MQTSIKEIIEGIESIATTYFSDEIKYVGFNRYPKSEVEKDCIALVYYIDSYPSAVNISKVSMKFEFLDLISTIDDRDDRRKEVFSDTAGVGSGFIDYLRRNEFYIDDNVTMSKIEPKTKDGVGGTEFIATFNYSKGCVVTGDGYKLKALTVGQLIESTEPIVIPIANLIENNSGLDAYFKRVYSTDDTLNLSLNEDRTLLTIQTDDLTERFSNISFTVSNGIINSTAEIVCRVVALGRSGIGYLRSQLWSGQSTSYFAHDEAAQFAAEMFEDANIDNCLHVATLDFSAPDPFLTLKNNNEFGNKNRFTDKLGTQVYAEDYAIDHLTGYGFRISVATYGDGSLASSLTAINSVSHAGYDDYFATPWKTLSSVTNYLNTNQVMNYSPFNIVTKNINTATFQSNGNLTILLISATGQWTASNLITAREFIIYRKHY